MLQNEFLEKHQDQAADSIVAEYTVTAEGGGAVCNEKPPLRVHKNGIHLHFLRYGLFDKSGPSISEHAPSNSVDYPDPTITPLLYDSAVRIKQDNTRTEIVVRDNEDLNAYLNLVPLVEVTAKRDYGIPNTEKFAVGRTCLRPGYLYLYDDADPANKYMEYEVLSDSRLRGVPWSKNKNQRGHYEDERKSYGRRFRQITFAKGSKWWICFSPIQWTVEYVTKLALDKNMLKRRGKLVHCTGFPIQKFGQEQPGVLSYQQVTTVFPKKNTNQQKFHKTLDRISELEKRELEGKKQDNNLLEDMFVCLHDPMGCALDISAVVESRKLQFMATVDAIQSGEDFATAYERLNKGDFKLPKPDKEYGELFTLALTSYQLVYNKDENIMLYDGGSPGSLHFPERHSLDPRPEYGTRQGKVGTMRVKNSNFIGNGLDYKKIEGVLGIQERKKSRQTLLSYREDFGQFLRSTYVRKHLDDYLDNHDERFLEGRGIALELVDPLSFHPYKYDRHLLLRKDFVEDDTWVEWVHNFTSDLCPEKEKEGEVVSESTRASGEDPLYGLLGLAFNVEKFLSKTRSFSTKLAKVLKKNLQYRFSEAASLSVVDGQLIKSVDDKLMFVVDRLNKITVHKQNVFHLEGGQIRMRLKALGLEIDPEHLSEGKYRGQKDISRFLQSSYGEGITYQPANKGKEHHIYLRTRKNFTGDIRMQNEREISNVLHGRSFAGMFLALEFYNFQFSLMKAIENNSKLQDKITVAGDFIKLLDAGRNLSIAMLRNNEKTWVRSNKLVSNTKFLGRASGAVTAIWCLRDAYEALQKDDFDATALYTSAGLVYGLSILASGPIVWIAAAAGLGLLALASFLTDSALETYFKKFILGDKSCSD